MPYIDKSDRTVSATYPTTAGELNFAFTQLILTYMDIAGLQYQTINDIIGALEGAKLEFYRRIALPYENEKIVLNGDVYDSYEIYKHR